MAVNAPGTHQALADGSPTCSVPGLSQQSTSPQSAASARSEPGLPGTRSAIQSIPLRPCTWAGLPSCTALTPGSTGGLT